MVDGRGRVVDGCGWVNLVLLVLLTLFVPFSPVTPERNLTKRKYFKGATCDGDMGNGRGK